MPYKADPNHPLHGKLKPRLEDLKVGRVTVTALAKEFGIAQPVLSIFIKRHYPDNVIGRGGIYPTEPAMLAALEEAMTARNVAVVARKHGVDYLGLVRRVKSRKAKAPKLRPVKPCQTAEQWTEKLGFTVRLGAEDDLTNNQTHRVNP